LESTTLGNFGPVGELLADECSGPDDCGAGMRYNATMSVLGQVVSKESVIIAEVYLDLAALLLFTAFVYFIQRKQPQMIHEVDAKSITIEDYSVLVKGIPPDTTPEELLEFMERRFSQVTAQVPSI
jgi:hypothetical protein